MISAFIIGLILGSAAGFVLAALLAANGKGGGGYG